MQESSQLRIGVAQNFATILLTLATGSTMILACSFSLVVYPSTSFTHFVSQASKREWSSSKTYTLHVFKVCTEFMQLVQDFLSLFLNH
jgi:hypothetical protein